MTTVHPACTRVSATARPKPAVDPVTSATLPSSPKKELKNLAEEDMVSLLVQDDSEEDLKASTLLWYAMA
eukprot:scaffold1803_cov92-Amphora_coffeaeformis.AAC.12